MSDLPGHEMRTAPSMFDDLVATRATYETGQNGQRYGAMVLVPRQLMEDSAIDVNAYLRAGLDRRLRPWLYADPQRWPNFEPFPRWTKFAAWVRRQASQLRRDDDDDEGVDW